MATVSISRKIIGNSGPDFQTYATGGANIAATREALASQLPGRENGPADALRHLILSAELMRNGTKFPSVVLSAHEYEAYQYNDAYDVGEFNFKLDIVTRNEFESKMDDSNNDLGMKIGYYVSNKGGSYQDVVRLCTEVIQKSIGGRTISSFDALGVNSDGIITAPGTFSLDGGGLVVTGVSLLPSSQWRNNPKTEIPLLGDDIFEISNDQANWPDRNGTWLSKFNRDGVAYQYVGKKGELIQYLDNAPEGTMVYAEFTDPDNILNGYPSTIGTTLKKENGKIVIEEKMVNSNSGDGISCDYVFISNGISSVDLSCVSTESDPVAYEYAQKAINDLLERGLSASDQSIKFHMIDKNTGKSVDGLVVCGEPADRAIRQLEGIEDNPKVYMISCGQGDGDTGLFIPDGTKYKDKDGVYHDAISAVDSNMQAEASLASFVMREAAEFVGGGLQRFNFGHVLGNVLTKLGTQILNKDFNEDKFLREVVIECGTEFVGASFNINNVTNVEETLGGWFEKVGFKDGTGLAHSLKGALFSIAVKLLADSKGMDGEDYAKATLSVAMGTAVDHVVAHNWGLTGPIGAGTGAAIVSVVSAIIDNPELDAAALRQISVSAGVAFASVAAAELLVGTLAEVCVTTGTAASCATVGSVVSSSVASGLTSTFGASAGGAIFTGLSAAVVPVVGAVIGVLISQGIGLVYHGKKLYPGQYMSTAELLNANYHIETVDGKNVLYVTNKDGATIGPWTDKTVQVLVGVIGSDSLIAPTTADIFRQDMIHFAANDNGCLSIGRVNLA